MFEKITLLIQKFLEDSTIKSLKLVLTWKYVNGECVPNLETQFERFE